MGKALFQPKKTSKKSKHSKHGVNSKKSQVKDASPNPDERHFSSMTAPASTNLPTFRDETYDPYTHGPTSAPDPYSGASIQGPQTLKIAPQQSNSYPSVQVTNYASTASGANDGYMGSNTYYQHTSQPRAYDPDPAQEPSRSDVFYTHGETYADSFTTSEYPPVEEGFADQYQEHSSQLQIWAEETSDMILPVNERLVRSNWE
ncbi:hypothetical protein N431DRAFT_489446 [Stipitochalara longipes BDJ]|nr:hypothetical protein N431DRAFT_489446 [Stipitochalara longipes BDJ]